MMANFVPLPPCTVPSVHLYLLVIPSLRSKEFFYSLIVDHLFKWATLSELDFLSTVGSTRVLVMGQE